MHAVVLSRSDHAVVLSRSDHSVVLSRSDHAAGVQRQERTVPHSPPVQSQVGGRSGE